jgi:peptidylprolyl isomerase
MVIISVIVVAHQISPKQTSTPQTGSPVYSIVSSSYETNAGSDWTFSVLWTDEVNVSGYIFETNNTGVFVNDTWTPFSNFTNSTSAYASVTKSLNSNVGDFVSWTFWCNNTSDRWTVIPMQSFLVVKQVLLETKWGDITGDITIQLFGDMPITSGNFLNLTETGVYDGTNFTRIVPGFVIQGGDASGKGITVKNIADELPNKHSNVQWTVAMAKGSDSSGNVIPNSATSQFFINLEDNSAHLDPNYTVFGTVISGMNYVDAISQLVPSSANATGYDGVPSPPVTIITATLGS